MERSLGFLVALTLGCTFAAALFGFGAQVYAWKSAYAGDVGREQLILLTRLLVFVTLAVVLVFRGRWHSGGYPHGRRGDLDRVGTLPVRLRMGCHRRPLGLRR